MGDRTTPLDREVEIQVGERLLPGRVEKLRIPGSGHYPLHQARNDVLAASIRFVRSVTASGTRSPRLAAGG